MRKLTNEQLIMSLIKNKAAAVVPKEPAEVTVKFWLDGVEFEFLGYVVGTSMCNIDVVLSKDSTAWMRKAIRKDTYK